MSPSFLSLSLWPLYILFLSPWSYDRPFRPIVHSFPLLHALSLLGEAWHLSLMWTLVLQMSVRKFTIYI